MHNQKTDPVIDEIISYLYEELSFDQKVAFEGRLSSDQLLLDMVQGQRNFRDVNDIGSSKEHRERFYAFIGRIADAGETARHIRRSRREN